MLGSKKPRVRLSNSSVAENATIGTTIGALSVVNHASGGSGWTFVINSQTPSGKLAISGANLNTAAALDYETNPSLAVVGTASKSGQADLPFAFTINVTNVFEGVNLIALTLDDSSIPEDAGATINIIGAATGSAITVSSGSLPSGMTLNSGARTITGTPVSAATSDFTLRETLADSANSPRDTTLSIVVTAAGDETLDPDLTPPAYSLVDAITVAPIRLDIEIGVIPPDEYLELKITSDIAGSTAVFNPAPVPVGSGDIVFPGLSSFTPTGEVYIWVRRWNAALNAYGPWPIDPVMWGDATAPTISIDGPITANDGAKMAVAFTTDETSTISITGTDAALIEIAGSGTSFIARLLGDANLNYGAKSSYSFNLVATDGNGNASAPAAVSYTVMAPAGAAVWNPADKSAGFTVSNSDHTVTQASGSGSQGIRGLTGRDETTKRYFAVRVDAAAGGDVAVCVANSSAVFSDYPGGSSVNSTAYYSNGVAFALGGALVPCPSFGVGDIIGVVVKDSGLGYSVCWFLKNGTSISGDPVAETGGFLAPAGLKYPMFHMQAVGQAGTLVLGTPPSGCTAWELDT